MSGFVLRAWCATLSLQMQGLLLTAIRGPDREEKDSPTKGMVRAFRAVVLRNAFDLNIGKSSFMGDGSGEPYEMDEFLDDLDSHAMHWLLHYTHAIQVIAERHPNPRLKTMWRVVYENICSALHMNTETSEQFEARLKADGVELACEPCPICGHGFANGSGWPRCANCLTAIRKGSIPELKSARDRVFAEMDREVGERAREDGLIQPRGVLMEIRPTGPHRADDEPMRKALPRPPRSEPVTVICHEGEEGEEGVGEALARDLANASDEELERLFDGAGEQDGTDRC